MLLTTLLRFFLVATVSLAIWIQYRLQATNVFPIVSHLPALPDFPAASDIHRNITGQVEIVGMNELVGPESLVQSNGYLFVALGNGQIARLAHTSQGEVTWTMLVRTGESHPTCGFSPSDDFETEAICGRPLGMKVVKQSTVDPNWNAQDQEEEKDVLLVADAYRGLLMVNNIYPTSPEPATVTTLATRATTDRPDYQFRLLNALVQTPDGSVYMTETSQTFSRRRIFFAAFDGRSNGRLLKYSKGTVHVVLDNLYMPNGVALSHSGRELVIVCGVQILRYSLENQQVSTFVSVMPGTGDNIDAMDSTPSGVKRNCYWAGLGSKYAKPFSLLKLASDKAWLKSLLVALVPYKTIVNLIPKLSALAVYDDEGQLLEVYHDDSVIFPWISEGEMYKGYLYLGSWYNPSLARVKV